MKTIPPMPPMPTTSPVATAQPGSAGKTVVSHVVAAAIGGALAFGAPVVKDNWPITMPTPVVNPAPVVKPAPIASPAPIPTPADPYADALKTAYDLEWGAKDSYLKRLLYLYRGTLESSKTAKTQADLRAAFVAEETRLEMTGKLPLLRAVVQAAWLDEVHPAAQTLTPIVRDVINRLLTRTIAVLEKMI